MRFIRGNEGRWRVAVRLRTDEPSVPTRFSMARRGAAPEQNGRADRPGRPWMYGGFPPPGPWRFVKGGLFAKFPLDAFRHMAHPFNCLFQLVRRDAEFLRPVAEFVVLIDVDAVPGRPSCIGRLPSCLAVAPEVEEVNGFVFRLVRNWIGLRDPCRRSAAWLSPIDLLQGPGSRATSENSAVTACWWAFTMVASSIR